MALPAPSFLRGLPADLTLALPAAADGGPDPVTDALGTYSPWALVGFAVFAIFRGYLLPKSVVDDLRAELLYTRERLREVEAQRDMARAETSRTGVALAQALPPRHDVTVDQAGVEAAS